MCHSKYHHCYGIVVLLLSLYSTGSHALSPIPQTNWSVWSVDSEELIGENGAASNAFDGDPATIWHTQWKGGSPTPPHDLRINLGGLYDISGLRYLPRQDGDDNGRIRQYQIYVSTDGTNWGTAVASGTFQDTAAEQEVQFAQVPATHVRLVAVNSYDGDPWTALAEINVLEDTTGGSAVAPIPQTNWSVWSVDSEELIGENGAASNAFDGNPATIWHTQWKGGSPTPPHDLRINLGGLYDISGLRYLPRQDGDDNGRIRQYQIYVSTDGTNWGTPVASGTFQDTAAEQEVQFAQVPATHVRLVAVNSYDGDPWTALAEINVLGNLSGGNLPPNGTIDTPLSNLTITVGDSVNFSGTGTDPENDLPLSYRWKFGAGSGLADATVKDPGPKQFNNPGSFTVTFTVSDATGLSDPTPAVRLVTVQSGATVAPIPQTNWSVWSVDSEELIGENGAASNAFDGDPATIWHTQWKGGSPTPPHDLRINLGDLYDISGLRYLPRQDGDDNGRIRQYQIYVSTDGTNWGTAVASGTFADTASEQEVLFAPVPATHVRLVAVNSYDGDPWTSLAEINVLGDISSAPVVAPIPQTNWSVWSVDSEEVAAEDGAASNAIDGNPDTYWHTQYGSSTPLPPHDLQISLGGRYDISGLRYLPRQDGSDNGRIRQYAIYVSTDGTNWGTPVASGTFQDTTAEQEVQFAPVPATHVRLVAVNSYDGDPWTALAEINVLGDLSSGNLSPNGTIDTPLSNLTITVGNSVNFSGTGTDPENNLPLSYRWKFGAGSGLADATVKDPGPKQFNNPGSFTVTFTVSDATGLSDPSPDSRRVNVCTPPSVSIDQPAPLHLQSASSLVVSATPCLDPLIHSGWGVRFTITRNVDGVFISSVDDNSAPFETTFSGLSKAEYTVDATIIDDQNNPVGGTGSSVQVSPVGIGDYYVGVGDSITFGLNDDIVSDNTSLDGRNTMGGYEPVLNNLLTNSVKAYPHTIVNKGVSGDNSADGRTLIPSILTDHPEAGFFLIQYGTNDAGIPIPDGLGKYPGQSGYNGTFKDNIQQIITQIKNAGKKAYLAKAPYAKGNYTGRNALIQKYNQVIDELITDNGIAVNGIPFNAPDFYTFFFNNQTQYSDDLHPNGAGYQSMGNLWANQLLP